MDYIPYDGLPYFKACSDVVKAVGLLLVELQVVPQKGHVHVCAVICHSESGKDVSVSDCSKAHHALQPAILSLLQEERDDITEDNLSMEVCSPGIERNIKNAAEFELFVGHDIKVWDRNVGDWVKGVIKAADRESVTLGSEAGDMSIQYVDIAKAKFIHN
ncbi:MAG: ribosome maturation factor [Treponema sp.]|nr:ribosome maturation factor [Treponema sp.]